MGRREGTEIERIKQNRREVNARARGQWGQRAWEVERISWEDIKDKDEGDLIC